MIFICKSVHPLNDCIVYVGHNASLLSFSPVTRLTNIFLPNMQNRVELCLWQITEQFKG